MRKILAGLAMSLMGLSLQAQAQQSVVVVELYTSQGCSSCPPADAILRDVAAQKNVLALGLHVDYWDYLGWKDELAQHAFTERQARFNTIMKSRYRLVTPQMIFQGQDYVAGAKREKALSYIAMFQDAAERADLKIERKSGAVKISLAAIEGASKPADVYVVRFTPVVNVAIKKGENAGRKIAYVNTVRSWDTVAQWNGRDALELSHKVAGDDEVAVIVQTQNLGPILVARRLD